MKFMWNAKSLVPLVHVGCRRVVKGTLDISCDEDELLSLGAEAMQDCCEHDECLLASATATAVKELLAVHAATASSWG